MPATQRRPRASPGEGEAGAPASKKKARRSAVDGAADAEPPAKDESSTPPSIDLEAAILALLAARRPGASACPSEVPRRLLGERGPWRPLMPAVRAAAARLEARGAVWVTQRGVRVEPAGAKGPIRLRLPPRGGEEKGDGGGE